jgi:hypothetical protein
MDANGYRQVGADFPVFLDTESNEWALARTERKSGKGYNGFETNFNPTITIEDDLSRRDLTINAMAVPIEAFSSPDWMQSIIDPFGGKEDLKNGILRHTSEAFADDPLRVLRIARFAARYNFDIEWKTKSLMSKIVNSGEINLLPKERIWSELEKGFSEKKPWLMVAALWNSGALHVEPLKSYFGNEEDFSAYELITTAGVAEMSDPNTNTIFCLRHLAKVGAIEAQRLRVPQSVHRMIKHFDLINKTKTEYIKEPDMFDQRVNEYLKTMKGQTSSEEISARKASFIYAAVIGEISNWRAGTSIVAESALAIKKIDFETLVKSGDPKTTIKQRVERARLNAIRRVLCMDLLEDA